jgi:hypothetical protein
MHVDNNMILIERTPLLVESYGEQDERVLYMNKYINIMEEVPWVFLHDIDSDIIEATLYGFVYSDLELSNDEWFRVFKSILINYKIMVIVFGEYSERLKGKFDDREIQANACALGIHLREKLENLNVKYADYLPCAIHEARYYPNFKVVVKQ